MHRRLCLAATAALIASALSRAAVPAEGDLSVALLEEAMYARLQDAECLLASYGTVAYLTGTVVRGERLEFGPAGITADGQVATGARQFRLDNATSHLVVQNDDRLSVQRWMARGSLNGQWQHDLTFIDQDHRRRQIARLDLDSATPRSDLMLALPRDDDRHHLFELGLGRRQGDTMLQLVRGPATYSGKRPLRGVLCDVVVWPDGELWLDSTHGYAPVRLIRHDRERDAVSADDWWAYREGGLLSLPKYHLHRRVVPNREAREVDTLVLTRVDTAVAGQEQVEQLAPVGWNVPVVVGSIVQAGAPAPGEPIPHPGFAPTGLWRTAEADCATWGMSIKLLRSDTELVLPGEG